MRLLDQIRSWWRRPWPAPVPPPQPPPPGDSKDSWLAQLLVLHNNERARAGLRPYGVNDKIQSCAMRYAALMAATGRMSHSADGTSVGGRIAAQGYPWQRAGENIAAGQPSPDAVVRDWMNSPGHKQNILGPYPDIGFGYARGLTGNVYWCADFASPMGGRLLDQAIIVEGFGQESVWEPPGRDARA